MLEPAKPMGWGTLLGSELINNRFEMTVVNILGPLWKTLWLCIKNVVDLIMIIWGLTEAAGGHSDKSGIQKLFFCLRVFPTQSRQCGLMKNHLLLPNSPSNPRIHHIQLLGAGDW